MKTKLRTLLVALTLLACLPHAEAVISATDTQITYQGMIINQLSRGSNTDDFVFTLFDTNSGGSRIAGPITNTAVAVNSNGLFTTMMDFGSSAFLTATQGQTASYVSYMEIALRTNGGSAFTTLTPRQQITSTPRSIYALTAGTALSVSPTTIVQGQSLSIGVSNILGGTLSTVAGGAYNAATLDYAVVAGGYGNMATSNSATVGGGSGNLASGDHAVVAGGEGNTASGTHSFVGGGLGNFASSDYDVVVGGVSNSVSGDPSFIGAGTLNFIGGGVAWNSWIAAGYHNTVSSDNSGIGGGYKNFIQSNSAGSFIGGGAWNFVQNNSGYSVIAGGEWNTIQSNTIYSVISGGFTNMIQPNSKFAVIAGGERNTIQTNSTECVISGGTSNSILINVNDSTVAGGFQNTIQSSANYSSIGGGNQNTIQSSSTQSSIGGGNQNTIQLNSPQSSIGGGNQNTIQLSSSQSSIGGGSGNTILYFAQDATIAGGNSNIVGTLCPYATIPGGQQAVATNYAQLAYSSGAFATAGDSQYSLYVLRGTTTTANPQTLFLDGAGATREIALPPTRAIGYIVTIVARDTTASVYIRKTDVFSFRGGANGSTLSAGNTAIDHPLAEIIGLPVPLPATITSVTSVGGGRLHINITGLANETINWTATVQATETAF